MYVNALIRDEELILEHRNFQPNLGNLNCMLFTKIIRSKLVIQYEWLQYNLD